MNPIKKFGKITEQKLEAWYGKDVYDQFQVAATGLTIPTPIMGIPASLFRGGIVPRIAGGMGFASLSDLIFEVTTNGKIQQLTYQKVGVAAPAASATQHLWGVGNLPSAGATMGATPSGTVPDNTTTGGLKQNNPAGGETLHITTWTSVSTVVGALMLYDWIWGVNINHATTANTVSGTPTRYTGTASAGNFISGRVSTVLAATAHNITVTYVNDTGAATAATTAQAVRVSSAVQTTPLTQPQWAITLNAGDLGVRNVTSIALSAASTGNVDWMIGHPLAIVPQPVANVAYVLDGINSAFNLVQVQGSACLAMAEFYKSATTACTTSGLIQLASG